MNNFLYNTRFHIGSFMNKALYNTGLLFGASLALLWGFIIVSIPALIVMSLYKYLSN